MIAPLVQTQHLRFHLLADETLLDGLERTGHAIEYQCRSGYCGACRLQLYQGEVTYLSAPIAYLAGDEVLPCCCVPKTPIELACELHPALQHPMMQTDFFPVQLLLFETPIPQDAGHLYKRPVGKRTRHSVANGQNLSLFA